jgi:hypothetical protein
MTNQIDEQGFDADEDRDIEREVAPEETRERCGSAGVQLAKELGVLAGLTRVITGPFEVQGRLLADGDYNQRCQQAFEEGVDQGESQQLDFPHKEETGWEEGVLELLKLVVRVRKLNNEVRAL